MFNIGGGEIALIMVAALLLLGPQRLPELARGIGKFMREFRRQTDQVRNIVEREFYKMDSDVADVGQPPLPPGTVAQGTPDLLPPHTDGTPSQLTAPIDAQHTGQDPNEGHDNPDLKPYLDPPSAAPSEKATAPAPAPAPAATAEASSPVQDKKAS